jgi:hypothetical protein
MSSAYVASLKRLSEENAPANEQDVCSLRERFLEWYSALPEISRSRAFAMAEFEEALVTQGKYLSPILLSLGWTRKRRWSGGGQYSRYWVPPSP